MIVPANGWPVESRYLGLGDEIGLFVSKQCEMGSVVFEEAPVLAAQLSLSRVTAPVCVECLGVTPAADKLLKRWRRLFVEKLPETEVDDFWLCCVHKRQQTRDLRWWALLGLADNVKARRQWLRIEKVCNDERLQLALMAWVEVGFGAQPRRRQWQEVIQHFRGPRWSELPGVDSEAARTLLMLLMELVSEMLPDHTRQASVDELDALAGTMKTVNVSIEFDLPTAVGGICKTEADRSLLRKASILLTGSAEAEEPLPVMGTGLFKLVGTLNHSCEPNVELVFEETGPVVTARALRSLEPNEELFISYVDETLGFADRQRRLHTDFHFPWLTPYRCCRCRRCCGAERMHIPPVKFNLPHSRTR